MPPTPPVTDPSCIRIEWKVGVNATIEAGSRIFMSYSGSAPSVADLNSLATAVSVAWNDTIAGQVNSTESLHNVTITDLSSDTGAVGEWTGTINGGLEGDISLPASACAVVNHQIARRYRGGRPRTYLRIGVQEQLSGTNEWDSGALTTFLGTWEGFVAAIIATTGIGITSLAIVNISFFEGFTTVLNPITGRTKDVPKLRTGGPLVDPITLSSVATKLGSQRRRLNI